MTIDIFRTKAGMAGVVLLVCTLFFVMSRLKARSPDQTEFLQASQPVESGRSGGVEEATLLKRAQESARGRAEVARKDRAVSRSATEGYDENGDLLQRRNTPEPLQPDFSIEGVTNDGPSAAVERILPALRIRGRARDDAGPEGSRQASRRALPSLAGVELPAVGPVNAAFPFNSSEQGAKKPERFVPFGRLIKAELVISIESTQDEMPLVGLIVEPVYNNGRLVIPAGTEVHSTARPDRVRDRIVSLSTWRLVFPREGARPNGRQLTFDGVALDRDDRAGNGVTWGITDGSYGLRGRTIRSARAYEDLKLFAAEALKAAGASLMDRQHSTLGVQVEANAKNAALAGGQAVLNEYAQRIGNELQKNGVYIQVPAGKQFYIYPRQVIDPDRADIPESIAEVE